MPGFELEFSLFARGTAWVVDQSTAQTSWGLLGCWFEARGNCSIQPLEWGVGHPNPVISSLLCLVVCVVQDTDAHTLTKHAMGSGNIIPYYRWICNIGTMGFWGSHPAFVSDANYSTVVVVSCTFVRIIRSFSNSKHSSRTLAQIMAPG